MPSWKRNALKGNPRPSDEVQDYCCYYYYYHHYHYHYHYDDDHDYYYEYSCSCFYGCMSAQVCRGSKRAASDELRRWQNHKQLSLETRWVTKTAMSAFGDVSRFSISTHTHTYFTCRHQL